MRFKKWIKKKFKKVTKNNKKQLMKETRKQNKLMKINKMKLSKKSKYFILVFMEKENQEKKNKRIFKILMNICCTTKLIKTNLRMSNQAKSFLNRIPGSDC